MVKKVALAEHEGMDRWKSLPVWAQQELQRWRVDEAHQRGLAETFRDALSSIGRDVCGREPLAAAYARGVIEETESPPVSPVKPGSEPKREER